MTSKRMPINEQQHTIGPEIEAMTLFFDMLLMLLLMLLSMLLLLMLLLFSQFANSQRKMRKTVRE